MPRAARRPAGPSRSARAQQQRIERALDRRGLLHASGPSAGGLNIQRHAIHPGARRHRPATRRRSASRKADHRRRYAQLHAAVVRCAGADRPPAARTRPRAGSRPRFRTSSAPGRRRSPAWPDIGPWPPPALDQRVQLGRSSDRRRCARLGAVATAAALDHVGRHRPRRAGETDQRPLRLQRRAHELQGLRRPPPAALVDASTSARQRLDWRQGRRPWPLAGLKPDVLAQRRGQQQDVGEHDGRVNANRRMGCKVASAAICGFRQKAMKSGAFCPQRPVFRQGIAPPGA